MSPSKKYIDWGRKFDNIDFLLRLIYWSDLVELATSDGLILYAGNSYRVVLVVVGLVEVVGIDGIVAGHSQWHSAGRYLFDGASLAEGKNQRKITILILFNTSLDINQIINLINAHTKIFFLLAQIFPCDIFKSLPFNQFLIYYKTKPIFFDLQII